VVLTLMVLTLMMLIVLPATAHPFVRGAGEVPIDSAVTITLDLAHGCGSEAEEIGQDTREVALEVPPWLRVLEVAGHPAYQHDLERAEGRIEVVAWSLAGTAEPAPVFELDVVATGTVGQTRYLAVFQGCEDRSHRWIGTPVAPADDPAIAVRLTAPDPDRPAPPESPTEELPTGQDPDEAAGDGGSDADPDPTDPQATRDAAAVGGGGGTSVGDPTGGAAVGGGEWSTRRWSGLLAVALVVGLAVLTLAGRGRRQPDRHTSS